MNGRDLERKPSVACPLPASKLNDTRPNFIDPILMSRLRTTFRCAIILAFLTGCGGEPESGEPTPILVAAATGVDSLGRLPPEQVYGVGPVENLWSPRFEIEVAGLAAGWDGARLAILSDFQIGLWPENEEVASRAVELALRANPDLVVLLGDYVAVGEDVGALQRVLAPLRGRRTLAVLGDRDVRSDSIASGVRRTLEDLGATILSNSVAAIEVGGSPMNVGGLSPGLQGSAVTEQQWVIGNLGADAGPIPLLLMHAPALAARAPADRFGVILAGNTFCGDVEVPGTPRLAWLASDIFPDAAVQASKQVFRVQGATLLVTCGLGYGFVPLRFGAAPEVPILTLVGVGPAEPEPTDSLAAVNSP